MSKKILTSLNFVDRELRLVKPIDMSTGTKITIELINGFELFNDTRYHNYETFSDGWRISDGTIVVQAEDLDDAVRLFVQKVKEIQRKDEVK